MFTIDRCDDSVFKNVFSFARTPRIPLLHYYTGVTAYTCDSENMDFY